MTPAEVLDRKYGMYRKERFNEIFHVADISQSKMADSLGITQSMVSKILHGSAVPSKTVMILMEILYGGKKDTI